MKIALTKENGFAGIALLFFGAFIGALIATFQNNPSAVWPAVSAVSSAIGASLASLALFTSRGALKESQRANRRSYEMFALDYRPWLSAEFESNDSIKYSGQVTERVGLETRTRDLWTIDATLKVRNHGKRPATNVQVFTKLISLNSALPQGQQMRDFAKDYMSHDNSVGPVIFPNEFHIFEHKGGGIYFDETIVQNSNGHLGIPAIVGCITYDGSATNERSQTRFMFLLDETSGAPYENWCNNWLNGTWVVQKFGFLEI